MSSILNISYLGNLGRFLRRFRYLDLLNRASPPLSLPILTNKTFEDYHWLIGERRQLTLKRTQEKR